jgi:hypothetical protein
MKKLDMSPYHPYRRMGWTCHTKLQSNDNI